MEKPEDLKALTSLRFVAAFALLLHHMRGHFGIAYDFTHIPLGSGVSFFFVLSGFILAHVYRSKVNWKRFYLARFARLWPSHLLCLVLAAVLIGDVTGAQSSFEYISRFIASVFLVQAWWPDFRLIFSFNSVSWSISTEVFFYLFFPLILWSRLFGLLFSVLLLVGAIGICIWLQLPPYTSALTGELTSTAVLYINPLARVFEFAFGVTAYPLWRYLKGRLRPALWYALRIISVALLATSLVFWKEILHFVYMFGGRYTAIWFAQSGLCIVAILWVVAFANAKSIFSWKVSVFLGNISFALYMCHQIILRFITSLNLEFSDNVSISIYLMLVFFFSILLWRFELTAKKWVMQPTLFRD
ncbi:MULTISPECIES: acyltransferase [unclassified Roseibium]|uniref:acyltransferase family protein n=1 Tax=unclassified Roseibium TaxID=2629323 RepID=UPI00273DE6C0|nr:MULTISPECIES: acyltransferase [unclassified Roseibium]